MRPLSRSSSAKGEPIRSFSDNAGIGITAGLDIARPSADANSRLETGWGAVACTLQSELDLSLMDDLIVQTHLMEPTLIAPFNDSSLMACARTRIMSRT